MSKVFKINNSCLRSIEGSAENKRVTKICGSKKKSYFHTLFPPPPIVLVGFYIGKRRDGERKTIIDEYRTGSSFQEQNISVGKLESLGKLRVSPRLEETRHKV